MRLFFATVTIALALSATATAIAQPAGPDQATTSQQPAVTTDLRAPDQVAPPPPHVLTTDQRTPDQVARASAPTVPTPATDDGPGAIVFVLIGLGAAMVLLAGGYLGVRHRHRVTVADDLAVD